MVPQLRYRKSFFISYFVVNTLIVCWAILMNCDYLYAILLLVWINMMFYSLSRLSHRIILFCFGISFFIFLLGRDGVEYLIWHEDNDQFTTEVNHHAYWSMLIALLGVWVAFFMSAHENRQVNQLQVNKKDLTYYSYVRKYSLIWFYIVYPFAMLVNIFVAYFVFEYGYASSFTDLRTLLNNSAIFYVFTKIEMLLPTAFAIYMATLPSKKEFLRIAKPYFIYLVFTLATGGRGSFVLGMLLILVFVVFMQRMEPDTVWINKKKLKHIVFLLPIVIVGFSFIGLARLGNEIDKFSLIDGFLDFFYDQGVTSNAIKHAYQYEAYIPKQKDFYTLEFLHAGIPARIFGNEVFQGNTIEHATKGGSFTHALGYTIMGEEYLLGRGPGTSYIAELYYDFGYIGVFLGSCIYGFIFPLINRKSGILMRSIIFMILPRLFWAPRGSFSGFLSFIFAPTTIVLLMIVFVCAKISYRKKHRKYIFALLPLSEISVRRHFE